MQLMKTNQLENVSRFVVTANTGSSQCLHTSESEAGILAQLRDLQAKNPNSCWVAFDNQGYDTIMITRGVDLLSHRAGLQPSGMIAPATHIDSGDVVKEIYKQGLRQAL